MEAIYGATSDSSEGTESRSNTGRTFRDGIRKIDLILVLKDEENVVGDSLRKSFLTNILKMGLEIEFEYGVLPINKKLIFFKVHCPNDVLNNLGQAFGVKCIQMARGELIMSHKERDWINVIRKDYVQPLQYSSLERSLIVYMTLLNLPFGNRQNYIGLERLLRRNIVTDAYALHDGPYFITKDASSINARQILFYNWAGITNIFTRQPLHLVHEYFGPKIALYFAYYGLYNIFLIIASIGGLIELYLAMYKNEIYTNARDTLCEPSVHHICSDCPGTDTLAYCYVVKVTKFCKMYSINILVDNKYAPYFAIFIIVWGVFFSVLWNTKAKYLNWVWDTANKDYNRKQTRPGFKANFETSPKSKKTGITVIGVTRSGVFITLFSYIALILLNVLVFAIILILRKKQDRNYVVTEKIENPEIVVPRLIYTMIGFAIVLFLIDFIYTKVAYYIVRKENHKTYEEISTSRAKHLYIMCFSMPMIVLAYFGFQSTIFKMWKGLEKSGFYGPPDVYNYSIYVNMCVMTSCLYELSCAFTIVLLVRFVILRKMKFYSSLTDYNQRALVQNVPCWEREFVLPRFKEKIIINRMKILVIQFTLIIAFGFAWPPTIIVVLFFNIYDMRRDAQLFTIHYRRPLLLKNQAFNIWTEIIKLMVYVAIIVNVVSLVSSTDTIEAYLIEAKQNAGHNNTIFFYLGLFFRHEHTDVNDPNRNWICCNTRGYVHVVDTNFNSYDGYQNMLTIDELRTYQYAYIFIFEIVMSALYLLLQSIFSIDAEAQDIPKKRSQQQSEVKALQDITY